MKKLLTLFTMLLLCTASSWADLFVPEIGIPYSLKCCSSEAHTANPYLGISNGSLNGQCAESARAYLKFEPVAGQEGHYYIKVTNAGNKYFNWNNGAVLADEAPTEWEFRTSYITGAVALAPVGTDSGKALNNNGGTGSLRMFTCTSASNACSHWEIIKEIYTTTYNITDPSGAVLTGQYSGEVNQAPAFSGMGYTLSNQTWTVGENHTATFTATLSFTADLPFQLSDMSEGGVRNYTRISAFDGGTRVWYRDGTTVKSANRSSIVGNPAYRWAISSAIEDNILGFKIYNQASGNYVTGNVENVTLGDGTLYIFNETGNGGKGFRVYKTDKLISFTSSNVGTSLTIWTRSTNTTHKGSNLTFYAAKELPFTPATIEGSGEQATFASDSKFYLMTLRTNYVRGWSENKFPVVTSRPDPILESDLWAFVGNSTDGFKIFNRAKGANVAVGLGTPPTSGNGSWGTVSTASAQKFALMQSIGHSGSGVLVATENNNQGLAVFNFKEIHGGSFVNRINTTLGYWKNDDNAPGEVGCDLVFYEAEEYSVNITGGGENGRIVINGTECANGQSFFNVKGETFSYSAKNIANYKAGEVAVDGNTISLTYTEAETVNVNVIYRYTKDNGEYFTLRTDETVAVQNEDTPVELSLTAEQTKAMKSANFVVGETVTPLTLPDFGTAFNSVQQLHVTSAEDIDVYVDLTLRPLPTPNKLYRFYNVGNSRPYMYQNESGKLAVKTTSTPGDLSEMFYVLETGTEGVYNIINAKNGKGYPEITWNNGSCNATFNHNGTFTFERQENLNVAIGQTTQSDNKKYLHANWNNGTGSDFVVVWNATTNNSLWYVIEVDPTELEVQPIDGDAQRFVIMQGEINCELSGRTFAEGLGNYHYTENSEVKYDDIQSAIYRQTTFANLQYLYLSVAINLPESGKFYRLKGSVSNKYAYSKGAGAQMGMSSTESDYQTAGLFYFNGNNTAGFSIVNYKDGYYVYDTHSIGVLGNSTKFTFAEPTTTHLGTLTIYQTTAISTNGRWMYDNGNKSEGPVVDRHSEYVANNCDWYIEEASGIPVTFKTAGLGYATFNSPVAVQIPEDTKAYVCQIGADGNTLTFYEITSVVDESGEKTIPANTPVLLYNSTVKGSGSDVTVSFPVTTVDTEITNNSFVGTLATAAFSTSDSEKDTYSLRTNTIDDVTKVGFYKKTSGTTLAGFKAWLQTAHQPQARNFTIYFNGEDDATGIAEALGLDSDKVEIYDLSGRKLSGYQKGINIVNGKKIFK